jgi:putative phosphonate metabolism protein
VSSRYAIYHAPAVDSPWWRFGAAWLGWDERRRVALSQPEWPEWSQEEFHALTAEPRRYGFHATLKAPFHLAGKVDEACLCRRVDLLARQLPRVVLGPLVPSRIGDFIALVPAQASPALHELAWRCVMELDDLRAPLTPEEIARRRPERLVPRARQFLERWGYPWVLDLFRFHLTLSGPVDAATGDLIASHAAASVAELNALHPPVIDRLCVFREDHPGAPFVRIHDAELVA